MEEQVKYCVEKHELKHSKQKEKKADLQQIKLKK